MRFDTNTPVDVEACYTYLNTVRVELRNDDILDPAYIGEKIVECRNFLSDVGELFLKVSREKTKREIDLANKETQFEVYKDSRLSGDSRVKAASSIEDRKALINAESQDLRKEILVLKLRVKELSNLEKVVNLYIRNLNAINTDIKQQYKSMELQIKSQLGGMKTDPAMRHMVEALAEIKKQEQEQAEAKAQAALGDLGGISTEETLGTDSEPVLALEEGSDPEPDLEFADVELDPISLEEVSEDSPEIEETLTEELSDTEGAQEGEDDDILSFILDTEGDEEEPEVSGDEDVGTEVELPADLLRGSEEDGSPEEEPEVESEPEMEFDFGLIEGPSDSEEGEDDQDPVDLDSNNSTPDLSMFEVESTEEKVKGGKPSAAKYGSTVQKQTKADKVESPELEEEEEVLDLDSFFDGIPSVPNL